MSSTSEQPSVLKENVQPTDPNEIEGIRMDLAALRMAIDLIRAQYEERMEAIRDAHKSIVTEASSQDGKETKELDNEVESMEMKMKMLESQAGGLETALDRYTKLFMEEVKGEGDQSKAADSGDPGKANEEIDDLDQMWEALCQPASALLKDGKFTMK